MGGVVVGAVRACAKAPSGSVVCCSGCCVGYEEGRLLVLLLISWKLELRDANGDPPTVPLLVRFIGADCNCCCCICGCGWYCGATYCWCDGGANKCAEE